MGRAAGVIRESAHEALQDLREIIGVLRAPEDADRPQPVLADLRQLVEESRGAGPRVTFDRKVEGAADAVPAVTGRTAYRVVQEGLTNARRHGPGPDAPVSVGVRGAPGEGLTVEIRNPGKAAPYRDASHRDAVPHGAAPHRDAVPHRDAPYGDQEFRPAVPGSGQGLIGLTERAHLAGGRLEHGWDDDEFRLHAWLPWSPT